MKFSPLFLLLFISPLFAQISDKVLSVKPSEAKEGQPLTLEAELVGTVQINQVLLAYRRFGASEYRQMEMSRIGNRASATIPGNEVVPMEMEYYLILKVEGKPDETYPIENPEDHPLRVQVQTRQAKDGEIIFLSPEEGTVVSTEELLISISLLRAKPSVNKSATKIYVDDRDVTQFAMVTEDLITLVPENVSPPILEGAHTVRAEVFDNKGKPYHSKTLSYTQISAEEVERLRTQIVYNAAATLEARNENIQGSSTPYNRANITATSEYGVLRMNGRLYVTNEEETGRQPQNRYFIEAQTPWFRLGYGDAYPVFSSLIMSGKRVRGLTANLTLGSFNLDFVTGETVRKVDGDTLRTFFKKDLPSSSGAYAPYDTAGRPDSLGIWAEYRYGTFTRDIMVVRPSFGSGKNVQFGLSLLKAKDDVESLRRNGILYGSKPEENLAVGSDLLVAFDDRRFEFTAQGGVSIYNRDISGGNITDAEIDSFYQYGASADTQDVNKKRKDLKELRDKISSFITVNQNVVPLSLERISSILAYETGLALNYFDNYFKASYIFRGSQYNSFGQTFIRRDVKGFNIFDRIRLMENQLFVSLGFESLEDNTDQSKTATTTFLNFNTTVSYFPRTDFPNITIGYGLNGSDNGLSKYDPFGPDSLLGLQAIDDVTNRFFIQGGYSFTAMYRQNASLSVSTSSRDDNTRRDADAVSTSVSGSLTTTWDMPLETSIGLALNFNELPATDPTDTTGFRQALSSFNYTTLFLSGRYRLLQDKLRVWASLAPTFGDVKRTNFDLGGEYALYQNLSALLQVSFYQNPSVTDHLWSIMLKYSL